jgi:hypothetical protein
LNLIEASLQLTELLLTEGSPTTAAEKFDYDGFLSLVVR